MSDMAAALKEAISAGRTSMAMENAVLSASQNMAEVAEAVAKLAARPDDDRPIVNVQPPQVTVQPAQVNVPITVQPAEVNVPATQVTVQPAEIVVMPSPPFKGWRITVASRDHNGSVKELLMEPLQ